VTKSLICDEGVGRRLDDDVDPFAQHVELRVSDEDGELDEGVGPQVEAGHLAVDPYQVVHSGSLMCLR